jgi:hypothetical protein
MRKIALVMAAIVFAGPALADTYPVAGRFGVSAWSVKGAIHCTGRRTMTFTGNQRRDTGGGVPAFRNRSVTSLGGGRFAIVDEFATPQVHFAYTEYDLQIVDDERIALGLGSGQVIKLQRCD